MEALLNPPREELPLAAWARAVRPSAIGAMMQAMARPGVISFALGLPAPELFPVDAYTGAAAHVLRSDRGALQYRAASPRLKAQVAELMQQRGVLCRPEQVFLTTGAQQALALFARMFLEPGGTVLCERLVYMGFRQVLEPFSPSLAQVDTDPADGMDVDALARLLAHGPRPALIYAMPRGHNPVAAGMSAEKMERLASLAARHGVPVIEDDAYGFLQYGPAMRAPLRALDAEWVCYAGSFSKIMAPGLRQGWLVVPPSLVPRLAIAKEAADIDTATLAQRTLSAYLETGRLPEHVDNLRRTYGRRRDAMLRAIETHFPDGTRWQVPDAGLFLWVELPAGVRADSVLRVAVEEERVAFLPGNAFAADRQTAAGCMRLNFSHPSEDAIDDGIRRLARAIDRARKSM